MSRTSRTVALTVVAFFALVGTAYALAVDPAGGPIGSHYTVEVDCATPATIRVFPLSDAPQATVPPEDGTESPPGTWTFDEQAGNVDELVVSDCDGHSSRFRYDVDAPALFPGPTVVHFGDWDPRRPASSVIGTDCPEGTTASVRISGPDGFTDTQTAPIDRYGNWEVPIPATAPSGDLSVDAACGALRFDAITIRHTGSTTPGGTGSDASSPANEPSAPSGAPSPATPVAAIPNYTG
ncbi:MAG TPA: hypothetical protein VFN21_08930 [Acidimicrobiales bacterium]|nr:hypothetical protein [Acidimicrobiales bacterium]